MAAILNNFLDLDIDVFFQHNGNRRGAFAGNDSKLSKNGNQKRY